MYYEVLVNGERLGTYGHPHVSNMSLSVQVTEEGPEIFASGVCREPDGLYMYNWLQHRVSASDVVVIKPTTDAISSEPRSKYKMGARGEA